MIIRAFLSGACEDLYFVPCYVGYDRVLERTPISKRLKAATKHGKP